MSKIYHTQTLTIFKYLSLKFKHKKYIVMNVFIEAIKIYKSIEMWETLKPVITEIIGTVNHTHLKQ